MGYIFVCFLFVVFAFWKEYEQIKMHYELMNLHKELDGLRNRPLTWERSSILYIRQSGVPELERMVKINRIERN